MNVALPALIVFIILLPGFLVRSRFKRVEQTSLDYSPFGQLVTEAVLWACLFHAIWLSVGYGIFGRVCDVTALLKLLSSDSKNQSAAIDSVAANSGWICFYFASQLLGANIIPWIIRSAVVHLQLDRFDARGSGLFRFNKAPWYYLLTGADFKKEDQPDFIYVSAVVDLAGEATLYTGILDEFFVGADGTLDRMVLQQVTRRPISADKGIEVSLNNINNRFYEVDGDYFVLRYSEAITLNIQYIKLAPADAEIEVQSDAEATTQPQSV